MADSQPAEAKAEVGPSTTAPSTEKPENVEVEDDSDPDFDDLDDVLDQFSAAAASSSQTQNPPSQPPPSASGPGRPSGKDEPALPPDIPIPQGPGASETEEEFVARLTAEMSSVMSKMSADPAAAAGASPDDIAKMGAELEEFTRKMEAEGIQPEDLLKAILGEDKGGKVTQVAEQEREFREAKPQSVEAAAAAASSSSSKPADKPPPPSASSFEDTIRKTMARMESSSAAASSATAQSTTKSEEDMLAEMLRALDGESGAGGGDGDLSKMFLGMMEQLTNKDMLYEPMKELSTKYPDWLVENRPKLAGDEFDRFSRQRVIVDAIVAKFEQPGYSDDDPACREFVWEKMQAMQAEGAPPEDLIANPFPGMGGGLPGLDAAAEGLEEGCPTQ